MDTEPQAESVCHCAALVEPRDPDPWEGRLDGYCYDCALARCDAFPGECPRAGGGSEGNSE